VFSNQFYNATPFSIQHYTTHFTWFAFLRVSTWKFVKYDDEMLLGGRNLKDVKQYSLFVYQLQLSQLLQKYSFQELDVRCS